MQVRLNDTATCMGDNSEPEGRLLRAEGSPGLRCFIYIYYLKVGVSWMSCMVEIR